MSSKLIVGFFLGVGLPPIVVLLAYLGKMLFSSAREEKNYWGMYVGAIFIVGPMFAFFVNTNANFDILIGTIFGAVTTYIFFWRKVFK